MVAEEICQVSARLIVNIASMKLRKTEINEVITQIESFVQEQKERRKEKAQKEAAAQ